MNTQEQTSIELPEIEEVTEKIEASLEEKKRTKGRSQIKIKFSREETEAIDRFKQFTIQAGNSWEDTCKMAFFKGLDLIRAELIQLVNDYEEHKRKVKEQQNSETEDKSDDN